MNEFFAHTDDTDYQLYTVNDDSCYLSVTVNTEGECTLVVETESDYQRVHGIRLESLFELLDKMTSGDYEMGALQNAEDY